MVSFKAPSGATVEVTLSDYATSFDLMKAVLKAMRQGGVGSKLPPNLQLTDISKIAQSDISSLGGMADVIIDVITSPEVDTLIFKCMERCIYDGEKVCKGTFEKETRRGDFLFVAYEVGKININPFLSHLLSGLKTAFQAKSSTPAPK
ncbi:MAG: hypothetical protein KAV87_19770 [Desulfobacteraceae bacterium]|nr:hypothetical protein [Desulfobacteraceae bacterium]